MTQNFFCPQTSFFFAKYSSFYKNHLVNIFQLKFFHLSLTEFPGKVPDRRTVSRVKFHPQMHCQQADFSEILGLVVFVAEYVRRVEL